MNQVMENILTRRSIRAYKKEAIPKEILAQILQAAIYAPSAMNRQLWQFTAVVNRDKIQALAKLVGKALGDANYNFYEPAVLVIASNDKAYDLGKEDNACALENMFLAAHSFGIGSVWINQLRHVCEVPEVRAYLRELGIPDAHVIYGVAALGYAANEPIQKVTKKGVVKMVE